MKSGRVYMVPNAYSFLQIEGNSCPAHVLDTIFASGSSSSSFHGVTTGVGFEGESENRHDESHCQLLDLDEMASGLDDGVQRTEKKRRLTSIQVQFLERNFEVENKLEPEKKIQLAKELGLHPRQVAIWFQNRRARWKTKQLEKDFEFLKASYESLRAEYDKLLKEKEMLKTEILHLSEELLVKATGSMNTEHKSRKLAKESPPVTKNDDPSSDHKDEIVSTARSTISVSDSPHHTEGGCSSLLGPGDSSHSFDYSDLSHVDDEVENNLSRIIPSLPSNPFKFDDAFCMQLPSCNYGYPLEDQGFLF